MSSLKGSVLLVGITAVGGVSGPVATPARAQGLDGDLAGDRYGEAVAWVGDVNHDGISDFAVGVPMGTGSAGRAGVVKIYFGVPGGTPSVPARILEGEVSGDQFGYAVAPAGDVNQDGFDDFLVGAPGYDGSGLEAGRAYLFLGGSPPGASPARTWDGDLPGSRFGGSVAGGFDFNQDLHPDFAIGAPDYSGGASRQGQVKIYLGSTTVAGITQPAAYVLVGDQANWSLGFSLNPAGDLNDDGRSDLVAGAPQPFDLNSGRAVVWFGQTSSVSPPGRLVLTGQVGGDRFGWSVSAAGDFDQDLYADLAVGAPGHDSLGVDKGAVYLFRGGPTVDGTPDGVAIGTTGGDSLGFALDGGWDRTGDGIPDIVAGAPGADGAGAGAGEVRVFRGGAPLSASPDTVILPVPPIVGYAAEDRFGAAVRFVGSIDGDALADLAVGAPSGNSASGANAGYVDVFLGADGTVPVRVLSFAVASVPGGALVSWSLAGLEDLAGVGLTVRRGGEESALLTGWLAAETGSWTDPSPSPGPAVYRLWGLDRTGGSSLLGEAAWNGEEGPISRLVTAPNPFRAGDPLSISLPSGTVRAAIVDVRGREVCRLLPGNGGSASRPLTWDGRDASGRAVPPGVYLVRADGPGKHAVGRVVLLP